MEANQKSFAATRGPFRGILIKFHQTTNFLDMQRVLYKLTLDHPNFVSSEMDKFKCIIYYKSPYDVATVLQNCSQHANFTIDIYFDKFSRTLHPHVQRIPAQFNEKIQDIIHAFRGRILVDDRKGCLIGFKNFIDSALAHEELRRITSVKFSYLSDVPSHSTQNTNTNSQNKQNTNIYSQNKQNTNSNSHNKHNSKINNLKKVVSVTDNNTKPTKQPSISKEQLEHEIVEILRKHGGWIPNTLTTNQNLNEDNEMNRKKIKLAAEKLDFANISAFEHEDETNDQENDQEQVDMDSISLNADDSLDWETKSPEDRIEELKNIKRTFKNDKSTD